MPDHRGPSRELNPLLSGRFVGYDFSDEGIAASRREAEALGLENATFEVVDVAQLAEVDQFDLITAFDAIHDQAEPRTVLANLARALRPDGVFLMVDIAASSNLEDNVEQTARELLTEAGFGPVEVKSVDSLNSYFVVRAA
ncbi:MAG: class I SAM-dependent methyltransferase [Acidimicrobiales bacterium]